MEQKKSNKKFASKVNDRLNKFEGKVLFPDKLALAIEHIDKHGLPKEIEEEIRLRKDKAA